MTLQNIALFNQTIGNIMIAIFAIVCVALVLVILSFMNGGKKNEES